MGPALLWYAPFINSSGYGEEARGFLTGLERRGVEVMARSTDDWSKEYLEGLRSSPALAQQIDAALQRPVRHPLIGVVHLPGHAVCRMEGAAYTIARTMFETDSLPREWVERLNTVDEVWVPSQFNVETFSTAGVKVPLRVVPGGVDARSFRPGLRPYPIPGRRGCTFLSVFEWSYRKAPDVLLRAWAEAFSPSDDVCLALRSYPRGSYDGDGTAAVWAQVDAELAAIGRTRNEVAPIVVMGKQLATADMPRLVASADVFVGASRGEGWGRPLLEAMATGLPTIGTRWGGNLEFMDDDNSLLVDVERLSEIDTRMDMDFYHGQRWAEPSAEHLAELMRRAASDSALRQSLGRRARADVEARWQWHQVARHITDRIAELHGPASARHDEIPIVRWRGDVWADHSLATVNRELVSRLARMPGLRIEAVTSEIGPHAQDYVPALEQVTQLGRRSEDGRVSVEVRHAWPPDFAPAIDGRLVLVQPWEFGGIPAEWLAPLRSTVDEVWVPTTWVRDCYIASGVDPDKVVVVPNGVDTATFAPGGPQFPLQTGASIRFLYVGGLILRKGFDLLLDAFTSSFDADDDVCLVVKPFGADGAYRDQSLDGLLRAAKSRPGGPEIEVVDRRLSRSEMAALYRACDVLVHPYRGEGFGLPVAEAMACGLPTLVTGAGATRDFCDDTTSWLLDSTRVAATVGNLTPSDAGFWLEEPDHGQLRRFLRDAAESAEERAAKGAAGAARIAESFAWDTVAARAHEELVRAARGKHLRSALAPEPAMAGT